MSTLNEQQRAACQAFAETLNDAHRSPDDEAAELFECVAAELRLLGQFYKAILMQACANQYRGR